LHSGLASYLTAFVIYTIIIIFFFFFFFNNFAMGMLPPAFLIPQPRIFAVPSNHLPSAVSDIFSVACLLELIIGLIVSQIPFHERSGSCHFCVCIP
jgi:hypothetical protein